MPVIAVVATAAAAVRARDCCYLYGMPLSLPAKLVVAVWTDSLMKKAKTKKILVRKIKKKAVAYEET